jgi:hypothetical protein
VSAVRMVGIEPLESYSYQIHVSDLSVDRLRTNDVDLSWTY